MKLGSSRLPEFLVIGEQKCGTGWIRDRLREHPGVFMPKKEVNFFNKLSEYKKGAGYYERNFSKEDGLVKGEKSPEYFWQNSNNLSYQQNIFSSINSLLPQSRIILVLRNPAARAVSALMHHVIHRGRRIHPSLVRRKTVSEILLSGDFNFSHLGIIERGFYYKRLTDAYEVFGDRLLTLSFGRDIVDNPSQGMRKIEEHIGLPAFDEYLYDKNDKANKPSYGEVLLGYYFPFLRPVLRKVVPGRPLLPLYTDKCKEALLDLYKEDMAAVELFLKTEGFLEK